MLALAILPRDMGTNETAEGTGLERFRLFGWRFSEMEGPLKGLFLRVEWAPLGWTIVPMPVPSRRSTLWYLLLDHHGRVRAHPFYYRGSAGINGASPAAHCILRRRFELTRAYEGSRFPVGVEVCDAEKPVYFTALRPPIDAAPHLRINDSVILQRMLEINGDFDEAKRWLGALAPRWKKVLAYWGDEDIGILGLPRPDENLGILGLPRPSAAP